MNNKIRDAIQPHDRLGIKKRKRLKTNIKLNWLQKFVRELFFKSPVPC